MTQVAAVARPKAAVGGAGEAQAGGISRARWIALVVLCVGQLMIVLDATVVNVALPVLRHDLHFTVASAAWVVDAYLLAFGGLLLLAGRLGDLLGRKRVFLFGIALFTLSSLACGLSPNSELLIVARFVQGAGAAAIASMVLGILVTLFSGPKERITAMGVYAFVASSGGAIGLLVGGVLTQLVSWHWIFFVNLPIGVATFTLASLLLPPLPGTGLRRDLDLRGALLVTVAPSLAVLAIVTAGQSGWSDRETWVMGALTVLAAVAFIVVERRARAPLVRLAIFRSRARSGANLARVLFPVGLFGTLFLGSLYLQQEQGYGPVEVGLAFLPANLGMAIFSLFISKRIVARVGARLTVLAGLCFVTLALLLLTQVPEHVSYVANVLPAMLALGIGGGLFFMPSVSLAMEGVAPQDSGLASGLANVSLQFGAALGVAIVASVSASTSSGLLSLGDSVGVALTEGYRHGFLVGAVAVSLAVLVAALVLRAESRPKAGPELPGVSRPARPEAPLVRLDPEPGG